MSNIKYVQPDKENQATIKVSFQDIIEGRAYIRLSPEAKIKLCHMAGAPWNEKIPDAKLHDLQIETLMRPEREKIIHGGSRLGKSVLGGCEAICEVMLPFSKTAIVAQRYDHVGAEYQYVYKGLRKLFKHNTQAFTRIIFKHQTNYHDYDVQTIWGARCRGYSVESDEGAALLGQEFSRVVVGEGSHITPDILEKRIFRALDGWLMQSKKGMVREGGYLSLYTTPKGFEGCSASEWERVMKQTKHNPEQLHYGNVPFAESVWIREAAVIENPYYDLKVFEARKEGLTKQAFEETYLGKMTFKTGRIYKSYDEEKHRVDMPSPSAIKQMRLGVGIDTGAYTAILLLGVDEDNRKWALGEVYTQQETISTALEEMKEMFVSVLEPVFHTNDFEKLKKAIDIWVVDPASQHKMEIMEYIDIGLQDGCSLEGGKLQLIPSIDIIEDWFRQDKIFVVENLDWTHDQLRKYIWKHRRAGGVGRGAARQPVVIEPKKEYDHLCDALRLGLLGLHVEGPLEEAIPAMTIADAWEERRKEQVFGPLKKMIEAAKTRPIAC